MRGIPTFSRELAQARSEFVWEVWRLGGSGFARERSDRLMAYAVPLLLVALMRQTPVASPRGGDPYQGRGHAAHTNRRPPQVPLPLRAGWSIDRSFAFERVLFPVRSSTFTRVRHCGRPGESQGPGKEPNRAEDSRPRLKAGLRTKTPKTYSRRGREKTSHVGRSF